MREFAYSNRKGMIVKRQNVKVRFKMWLLYGICSEYMTTWVFVVVKNLSVNEKGKC